MYVAPERTLDVAPTLRASFATAAPFPHVVVEDALGAGARDLATAYPGPDWTGWYRHQGEYEQSKMSCSDIDVIPAALQQFIQELNGPKFLRFLEEVSGIQHLLPDPYLTGGGLHCSGPGGILMTHTDYHVLSRLGLYRRLNVIFYLNDGWQADWGGCLELSAPSKNGSGAPVKSVVPKWGTCVIFQTDDRSPHGFTVPVAPEHWRKSVALYYYTPEETSHYSGGGNTLWHPGREADSRRRLRQSAYRGLILVSRVFARLAYRCLPTARPS